MLPLYELLPKGYINILIFSYFWWLMNLKIGITECINPDCAKKFFRKNGKQVYHNRDCKDKVYRRDNKEHISIKNKYHRDIAKLIDILT